MGKAVFLDANIFLEIFLNEEKAEKCKVFLQLLQEQRTLAVTSDFIIYACILVVQRHLKATKFIKNTIIFFSNYPNLKIVRPSLDDIYTATDIGDKSRLDFDDSLVVACMKKENIKELASFDKHFDRVKSVKRIKL